MIVRQAPPYRACFLYGAGYTAVFVLVAAVRLAVMEPAGSFSVGAAFGLISGLVFAYGAGCLFAVPLVWTLRRFRMSARVPILLWSAAVPLSALGSLLGGLLGPPGILLLGGTPILAALGWAFLVQTIWLRVRSGRASAGAGG